MNAYVLGQAWLVYSPKTGVHKLLGFRTETCNLSITTLSPLPRKYTIRHTGSRTPSIILNKHATPAASPHSPLETKDEPPHRFLRIGGDPEKRHMSDENPGTG